jgi:hypothetical protein
VKYFLARHGVPYEWLDFEGDKEAQRLLYYAESTSRSEHSSIVNTTTTTTTITPDSSFSILDHDKTEHNDTY